jgi:hypothetical protein
VARSIGSRFGRMGLVLGATGHAAARDSPYAGRSFGWDGANQPDVTFVIPATNTDQVPTTVGASGGESVLFP